MEHPAFTLAGVCALSATVNYLRKGSGPHVYAGTGLSILYGYCGYLLKSNAAWGLEIALGCSTIMLAGGVFRSVLASFSKPIPLVLFIMGTFSTTYYGLKFNEFYSVF